MAAAVAASAAASTAASTPVFVYGTLMADEVLHALLDRVPASAPARLPNFTRHSIKGRQYPAIIPKADDSVLGKLLFNLSPPEMDLFDAFEDVEYVRHLVSVQGLAAGREAQREEETKAFVYVWGNVEDPDLHGSWDYEAWRRTCVALQMAGLICYNVSRICARMERRGIVERH
ncbi:hypothetical protein CLOM_g8372 [Closterium sp. NIES-68]|nr:hypothetical protein CLOM_g8372 [Closterium sp. NIES-68]GJP62526.1 hypothetical protein CLOP_g19579 [Closterium sp. NIES-67]